MAEKTEKKETSEFTRSGELQIICEERRRTFLVGFQFYSVINTESYIDPREIYKIKYPSPKEFDWEEQYSQACLDAMQEVVDGYTPQLVEMQTYVNQLGYITVSDYLAGNQDIGPVGMLKIK